MNMRERVRRGLLRPNVHYHCDACGTFVSKYVPPSEVAKRKAKNLYCSRACKGVALSGPNHPMWNGGRHVAPSGYIMVWAPDHPDATKAGYVREHRLVMERHLGRRLLPDEVVHHENRDKTDNRIENLRLFASQAEHKRHEIAFATRDEKGRLLAA